MHNQIASQYAPGDDLPCADASLLAPLKKSPEYRAIRPRVASPRAVDSWQDQGVHFFVFQLNPLEGAASTLNDPPVIVFAMHPEELGPVSAVVVTPKPGGEEAEVVDLRQPGNAYTAAYTTDNDAAQDSGPERENRGGVNERVPGAVAEQMSDIESVNGDTPDIDLELLIAIKQSPEFQAIHSRIAESQPTDSWREDNAHFFVFQLLPTNGSSSNGHEPPVAVFAIGNPDRELMSAVVVTPLPDGEDAEVTDLRGPSNAYSASLTS